MKVRAHPAFDAADMVALPEVNGAWRFHAQCQFGDFGKLRHRLGDDRANQLTGELAGLITEAVACEARVIGRNLIEFGFVSGDAAQLEQSLAAIRAACEVRFREDLGATASLVFGTAAAPAAEADTIALAEEAEAALHEARTIGRRVSHDPPAPPRALRARAAEIERGLEAGEFVLQYQPKLHVRRQAITSVEALIRWHHPERGIILPNDFIADAEQSHLIARMTLWAMERAIADQRRLAAVGHDLCFFINISGQLLANAPFVRAACVLAAAGEARLGFEITETSVIRDPASAIANLQRFADIGIIIAIDDYGAGLSSLAYLKQLPARELKIDKLFVTQLTSSNRDPLIVRSTIDLAHALDMEVVAEGVETHAALALLTVMGCDMVQGYLISRPIGIDALTTYLAEDRAHMAPEQTRDVFSRLSARWSTG